MHRIWFAFGLALAAPGHALAQDREDPFAAYDAGRYAEAELGATQALSRDAQNPVWWALAAESQAKLAQHQEAADAFAQAARFETDAGRRSYLRRAQALQLVYAGMTGKARAVVRAAMEEPALAMRDSLDWAVVAIAAKDDGAAQDILSNEALYADFTRQTALDAGYSAKRRGLDERAVRFFTRGLQLDPAEAEPLGPDQREAIRRENRELTRDWAFLAQGSFSTAGRPLGPADSPLGDEEAVQVGAEVARRIGGWRNGRPLSAFARIFHSDLQSDQTASTDVTQGWFGLRYKPLASVNLNIEASRLVGLDDGLDDWSLRAAISGGERLEPEVDTRSSAYAHYYGDLSYLTDADVAFGLAEGRVGYSFGLDQRATILTPYAVARLDLDTGRKKEEAVGFGVGLSLRHWFDETDTVAYRGFVDFNLQARQRIAGDHRATGVLATLTVGR